MQNKKSQVEDLLEFMFIVIVLVIFVLLFSFKGISYARTTSEQVKITTMAQESDDLLIQYFRAPVDSTSETNMADLLDKYFITNDEALLNRIHSITNDFFSKSLLDTDSTSWSLEINYPEKKPLLIESEKSKVKFILRKEISKMIIPSFQSSRVEVKLFITSPEEKLQI